MNYDMNQNDTYITAAEDASSIVEKAVLQPAPTRVVMPGQTEHRSDIPSKGKSTAAMRGKMHGMSLAWRGVRLLGVAFGMAAVWFFGAWVRYGSMPLALFPSSVHLGSAPSPILPPDGLLLVLGLIVLLSLGMMLLGTQDAAPRMKTKDHP